MPIILSNVSDLKGPERIDAESLAERHKVLKTLLPIGTKLVLDQVENVKEETGETRLTKLPANLHNKFQEIFNKNY